VVDDESAMREVLQVRLEGWGYHVRTVATVRAARAAIASFDPHVVISDLVMPDDTGMGLLQTLRADDPTRTVLMITAYGTIHTAVQAIKAGATDFLTKPLDYVALRQLLDKVVVDPRRERVPSPVPLDDDPAPAGIIGRGPAMVRLWDMIDAAAASEAPVLIVGESGAGKERVARAIHERSRRRERPFVPVNTAAIPEALAEAELFGHERGAFTGAAETRAGLIEEAHRGTLFLDEITEMPPALQPKLLRVLEDGRVRRVGGRAEMVCDARVIAATNRTPQAAVTDGRLRHDLLYRLDVMRVDVPPLRAHREDIPALAAHFLAQCTARYGESSGGLTTEALEALTAHDWPGNVRELRNVIERAYAAARGAPILPVHVGHRREVPDAPDPAGIVIPRGVTAADAERILILETLKATENNKAEAARRLGLDVKTIRNKLKLFHLDGGDE
jgi:DNA-binding NtrC family response regulator